MNKFSGDLGEYEIKTTDDGSVTLRSSHFNEDCHSLVGAWSETVFNYVDGCNICERALISNEIAVLEVGFGTGMGYVATLDALQKIGYQGSLKFYSLEIDNALLSWAKNYWKKEQFFDYPFFDEPQTSRHHFELIGGDAVIAFPEFMRKNPTLKFDAFYQDAFSPKVNSSLWSAEWFTHLASSAKKGAVLSTYSCAFHVTPCLEQAGFKVIRVPGFGKKKESLRAMI